MTSWFVVYTQPNGEARALANLQRQGFRAYMPSYRRNRSHARRVESVRRPLFPRYVFVALDLLVERWRPILGTFGVCDIVRQGDRPLAVPQGIVEALSAGEAANAFDEPAPASRLRIGDPVRILSGPFSELVGRFQDLADADRVVVLLDLLGREVRATISARAVIAA